MGTDYLGKEACVSANLECTDDLGYGGQYNILNNTCECRYGYLLSGGKCVSESSYCSNLLGLMSSYNSLTNKCECMSGYEMTLKKFSSGLECVRCSKKYGLYSSYNTLTKKCECDDKYTLDDNNQCVEKQNNVYFKLKEVDIDNKRAVIKSEYDNKYYLVEYRSGCYSTSFKRYINQQIVVNLGTDFNLDRDDKIVLQDDNEVCEI
ncbi:MAG: hypothetical protein Q8M92_04325, partial [Candidatus Subteraquimicrobiales bacterium]|nr:hypothetical protein [Candidatus Subteraquimicrobiales bacterium]